MFRRTLRTEFSIRSFQILELWRGGCPTYAGRAPLTKTPITCGMDEVGGMSFYGNFAFFIGLSQMCQQSIELELGRSCGGLLEGGEVGIRSLRILAGLLRSMITNHATPAIRIPQILFVVPSAIEYLSRSDPCFHRATRKHTATIAAQTTPHARLRKWASSNARFMAFQIVTL